jgi:hypothetical protein
VLCDKTSIRNKNITDGILTKALRLRVRRVEQSSVSNQCHYRACMQRLANCKKLYGSGGGVTVRVRYLWTSNMYCGGCLQFKGLYIIAEMHLLLRTTESHNGISKKRQWLQNGVINVICAYHKTLVCGVSNKLRSSIRRRLLKSRCVLSVEYARDWV